MITDPTEKHREEARELLPCPFCNGEAVLLDDDVSEHPADGKVYHVTCLNSCLVAPGIYGEETKEQAIQKWNTRTSIRDVLCEQHQHEFTLFHVGGCLECWKQAEIASVLSSRDTEIRKVLEGLSYVAVSDGRNYRHWCGRREPCTPACLAARTLYEKVQPPKELSDG